MKQKLSFFQHGATQLTLLTVTLFYLSGSISPLTFLHETSPSDTLLSI